MALHGKRIIVNADDLGFSQQVNESTLALMEAGRVTSATIMANGPCWLDAVALARSHPRHSFGVHLNLTEGRPLSSAEPLKPLLDAEGNFRQLRSYRHLPASAVRGAFNEWYAQVERVRQSGVNISHLDSHQYLHTQPRFFIILKRIQSSFGIRKVRLSKNIYSRQKTPRSPLLLCQKAIWNFALKRLYRTRTTAGFTDFTTFMDMVQDGQLPHPTLELMVHPGNEKHTEETARLFSWKPEELPFKVRLISYHEL